MNSEELPDDPVAALLRHAGRREQPSPAATARVFAATHAAWQADLARRRLRAQWLARVAAVTIAVVGAGWWWMASSAGAIVATLADGTAGVVVERDGARLPAAEVQAGLRAGDDVAVGPARGVVLTSAAGLTLRLAAGSRLHWDSVRQLGLSSGGLYVDIDAARASDARLAIVTPRATVEHVGTRFVVRTDGQRLRVAVRDGIVRVAPSRGLAVQLQQGDVFEASADGGTQRFRSVLDETDWNWVDALAPATSIDGRTLYEVLVEVAHGGGFRLRFVGSEVEQAARALPLNGRPLQLAPRAALTAILAATPYAAEFNGDELLIRPRS